MPENVFADFLSRIKPEHQGTAYLEEEDSMELAPLGTPSPQIAAAEELQFQLLSMEALKDVQNECPEIRKMLSTRVSHQKTLSK